MTILLIVAAKLFSFLPLPLAIVPHLTAVTPTAAQFPRIKTLMNDQATDPQESDEILDEEDIEIHDGDVTRTIIDGIISIEFSDRIQAPAEKSLDQTVVVKLLGQRIGYTILRSKLHELWKPKQALKVMDIENDYFLVTFRTHAGYLHALTERPWTLFGHYLTVEPWTSGFSTTSPFPSKIMVWIRLPGLPVTLYKKSLITEIGESIGPVIKLDYQTEWGKRGRFARMAVRIDLSKTFDI
ncbi:uncharacterized protein LOC120164645 [Hibiscus syriacus]|uniref:uncharacterized protein LOC120164645 n=1 Tax=Hibiscus syriacus TaxID=106335 RepID=UPI001922B0A3|nr:uncharacterized protein LOC120164645 [Hibiscus syriacus]